jgi:hypothetical protein
MHSIQQVFPANRDERTAELIPLVPPLLAVSVRLVPFSAQLRTVCLRFELYGCPAAGNANANDKLRFRDDNVNSIAGETVQSRGGTFSQLGEHVMARPGLLYFYHGIWRTAYTITVIHVQPFFIHWWPWSPSCPYFCCFFSSSDGVFFFTVSGTTTAATISCPSSPALPPAPPPTPMHIPCGPPPLGKMCCCPLVVSNNKAADARPPKSSLPAFVALTPSPWAGHR